jgi:hypothetical protein
MDFETIAVFADLGDLAMSLLNGETESGEDPKVALTRVMGEYKDWKYGLLIESYTKCPRCGHPNLEVSTTIRLNKKCEERNCPGCGWGWVAGVAEEIQKEIEAAAKEQMGDDDVYDDDDVPF